MAAKRGTLFLIRPDSRPDRPEGWYCPDCALVEGVLAYYPELREALDIVHVDFPRPRQPVIDLLGTDAHQDCPLLALDPDLPVEGPIVGGRRVITENLRGLLAALTVVAPGIGRSGTGSIFEG